MWEASEKIEVVGEIVEESNTSDGHSLLHSAIKSALTLCDRACAVRYWRGGYLARRLCFSFIVHEADRTPFPLKYPNHLRIDIQAWGNVP